MSKRCFTHRWKEKKRSPIYSYQECSKCGKRKSIRYSEHGYQPLDQEWLDRSKGNKVDYYA